MLPEIDSNYKPTFQKTQKTQRKKNTHKKSTSRDRKIKLFKPGNNKINLKTQQEKNDILGKEKLRWEQLTSHQKQCKVQEKTWLLQNNYQP